MTVVDFSRCALRFFDEELSTILGPEHRVDLPPMLAGLMETHGRPFIEQWARRIVREARARCKSPEGVRESVLRHLRDDDIGCGLSGRIDQAAATQEMLARRRRVPVPVRGDGPSLLEMATLAMSDPPEFQRRFGHLLGRSGP